LSPSEAVQVSDRTIPIFKPDLIPSSYYPDRGRLLAVGRPHPRKWPRGSEVTEPAPLQDLDRSYTLDRAFPAVCIREALSKAVADSMCFRTVVAISAICQWTCARPSGRPSASQM